MKALWLAVALAAGCARGRLAGPPAPVAQPSVRIDTLALKAHTYFLAHDRLAGRAAGTAGAEVAAIYLAAACRALGLEPVGGAAGGDFFQPVPLVEFRVDGGELVWQGPTGERRFSYPDDFIPDFAADRGWERLSGRVLRAGPAWQPPGPADAYGAVVVTSEPPPDRAVLDWLAERGVAGVVQLVADSQAYDRYRRSRGPTRVAFAEPGVRSSLLPPLAWIVGGPRLWRAVEQGAGRPGAGGEGPEAASSASVAIRLQVSRRPLEARNVACLLRGSEPGARDTALVLVAHYDHLGVGAPDSRGDSIYNGFSDNAAGVAMLLAIAQAMVRGRADPMRHSVIFLFPTAEELGLMGSDYYVAHPLWPLARTAGVIALDAGAPPAPPTSWRIAGGGSPLALLAVDVALARGWSATTSPATPNSDYYPFARSGVPAVFLIPGPGPYEGLSGDSSLALRRRWNRYHQPDDEWAEAFPFRGLQRYAEYAYLVARARDRGGEAAPRAFRRR